MHLFFIIKVNACITISLNKYSDHFNIKKKRTKLANFPHTRKSIRKQSATGECNFPPCKC